MTGISPETLDMIAIHGGLGTSALDVPQAYFFVLEEAVKRGEEDMDAFHHDGDRTTGLIAFASLHCVEILEELAGQDSRAHALSEVI